MKTFLPSWQSPGKPHCSPAPSAPASADDEPVPSDGFRATALLDARGLQITESTQTGAPVLATGISLSVARGEVIGLVGVTGSGAREIALAIAGRLPEPAVVAAGSILIDGIELVGASRRALNRLRDTKISLISPAAPTGLAPDQVIGRQLARTLRRTGSLSRTDAARRALELLEKVGLPDPQATSLVVPTQLEPTALLQVTIAAALSQHPDILILDEPTRAVEAAGEPSALELCRGFLQEFGLSIIVVSRNLGLAAATCDRVTVVEAGRVVEQASAAEILASPRHPHTHSLLEAARSARG
ncbi:ABC transporter ATP-binding protein [Cryobacterium sp. TMT1-19]|uniref:ATP-binding cassette domain-containing protein n=1 Tax=Cryobacterium sp. TMT1-19 TaxID=1259231 RepID=UPI00106BA8C9|nr:ATP-binding cassette domain-containing protein [Cryobacterium sp. TMT1-19]TFD36457.1 ABC transporter ATP-binding protein [Cryobacterium sp. TMT1-19]